MTARQPVQTEKLIGRDKGGGRGGTTGCAVDKAAIGKKRRATGLEQAKPGSDDQCSEHRREGCDKGSL